MPMLDLVPDCRRCAGLCCIATSFEASEDFAFTKAAGVACRHLTGDGRCAIHDELAARGFRGCAVYDCHGAGQRASDAFPPGPVREEAFLVLRELHELAWLLTGATRLCTTPALAAELRSAIAALDEAAHAGGSALLGLDVRPHRHSARRLLQRVREELGGRRPLPVLGDHQASKQS